MALVLSFDPENNILRASLDGIVTDDILRNAYIAAAKLAASREPRCGIWDMTGVTKFEVSGNTIRELASRAPILPVGFMRVLVVNQPLSYGLARMFQIMSQKTRPDLHVARTMEEAYRFLGINQQKSA